MSATEVIYTVRVDGHLDDHWSGWLGATNLTREQDGSTVLTVTVADQAQLHGMLARVRDIGVALVAVGMADSVIATAAPDKNNRTARPQRG